MAVAVVLIGWAGKALCLVVPLRTRGAGREDHRACVQIQRSVALQSNGITGVRSGRKIYCPAALCRGVLDGLVDGGTVDGRAIPDCAKGPDIEGPAAHTCLCQGMRLGRSEQRSWH